MNFSPHIFLLSILLVCVTFSGCKKDDDPDNNPPPIDGFCYDLNVSNSTYQNISGSSVLDQTTNVDDFWEIDLGFDFTLCDSTFNTLFITYFYDATFTYTTNGGFTDATGYEFLPIGSISLESEWMVSDLIVSTQGSAGSRVTTIEWKDFTYESVAGVAYNVNFQMQFFEGSNKIIYHYGPHNVTADFVSDQFEIFILGLYGSNSFEGLFLTGDPQNPTKSESASTAEMTSWPAVGTVYTFE